VQRHGDNVGRLATRITPWLAASAQVSTGLALALIGLLWVGICLHLDFERTTSLQLAADNAGNLTRAFEENVIRSIREVDNAIIYLRHIYEKSSDRTDWYKTSLELDRLSALTLQFSVIGADGMLAATNVGDQPPAPIDLSDRDHFRVPASSASDELFISKPVIGRVSNKWSIQLARRIRNHNGSFGGVMVASLDPTRIAEFYWSIHVGELGSISLIGFDGVVRARAGGPAAPLGADMSATPLFTAFRSSTVGSFTERSSSDGNMLGSYRAVKDLPLIVSVALAESEVLATYWEERREYLLIGTALTLLVLAAVAMSTWHRLRLDRAREALRLSEARDRKKSAELQITLDHMTQGLCMFDAMQRVVLCNERYARMYGLTLDEVAPGTSLRQIIVSRIEGGVFAGANPEEYMRERLAPVVTASDNIQELSDGRSIAISRRPLPGGGWITTHEDVTKYRLIEARIAHMAHHDALTDLPNRVLLQERLEQALTRVPMGEGLAVLCIDLDRFKAVNDTLGHAVGDQLLKAVAERLRGCVRQTDTIARTGGDEFAILQIAADDATEVTALATRIVDSVRAPYDLGDHQATIGISIGIAMAPGDGTDPVQLLKNADLALYRSKAEGRGTFSFFEPEMDARMRARRALEIDLRNALVNGEFEVYYQPFLSLQRDEISGFEALLRWHHPRRGMVSPTEFIPVAEEIGLIVPIGEWVLKQACAEAATWPEPLRVSVNLSPVQFRNDGLVRSVLAALAASELPGQRLELEITESALLQNNEATLVTVQKLRMLGVRISMDDFGTGYSSLSYLQSFPFDKIKIDRSFVEKLSEGDGAIAILRAIVSIAESLGVATIAEGVETQQQLEIVRREGCTEMQGYLFSPAGPAAEIARLLPIKAQSAA
jgi:diguanylate cyclase (GGDEF)-like protein